MIAGVSCIGRTHTGFEDNADGYFVKRRRPRVVGGANWTRRTVAAAQIGLEDVIRFDFVGTGFEAPLAVTMCIWA